MTDAELAVLQQLWEVGPCTIRTLTERLYPPCSTSCYATVQKLLERLEGKGCVARDRSAAVHRFEAKLCREELIARRLRAVAATLCGGSMGPLLAYLVQAGNLSAAERRALRGLLERRNLKVRHRRV
jgi:predicted transcriptional regulator